MRNCRITCVRHVQRLKGDKDPQDQQHLSEAGLLTAWVMGIVCRKLFTSRPGMRPMLDLPANCSPQPRSKRSAVILLAALEGDEIDDRITNHYEAREALNDYSHDERLVVKTALTEAKRIAKERGIEPEAALFECPEGIAALELKGAEALQLIDGRTYAGKQEGHYMFAGLHGGTIDWLYIQALRRTGVDYPLSTKRAGGIFDYGEGFTLTITPGTNDVDRSEVMIYDLKTIRQPEYLKEALAVMTCE